MELWRAVKVETPKPKIVGYDWAKHKLTRQKRLWVQELEEGLSKAGYNIDVNGLTTIPNFSHDFHIVPYLLYWVGAQKARPKKEWKTIKALFTKTRTAK